MIEALRIPYDEERLDSLSEAKRKYIVHSGCNQSLLSFAHMRYEISVRQRYSFVYRRHFTSLDEPTIPFLKKKFRLRSVETI